MPQNLKETVFVQQISHRQQKHEKLEAVCSIFSQKQKKGNASYL